MVVFRRVGIQLPLRPGDIVSVRRGVNVIGEVPAELVIHLVAHHFHLAEIQDRIQVSRRPSAPLRGHVSVAIQEARRVKRRQRG